MKTFISAFIKSILIVALIAVPTYFIIINTNAHLFFSLEIIRLLKELIIPTVLVLIASFIKCEKKVKLIVVLITILIFGINTYSKLDDFKKALDQNSQTININEATINRNTSEIELNGNKYKIWNKLSPSDFKNKKQIRIATDYNTIIEIK